MSGGIKEVSAEYRSARKVGDCPKGYKRTEVGVIPEEWSVTNVGSLCTIFGRIGFRGYTKADIVSEDQGVISISPSNIKDGKITFENCTHITWDKYHESPEIQIQNDDILLVKTGSTFGKVARVVGLPRAATLNPQVVVLKKSKCPAAYLAYLMQFKIIQDQINETIVGGAIPTLSQKEIANYLLPLPTEKEQISIANALSDVDALITSLESLIAKKRAIKTAAMQQLLTGKKRLPPFDKTHTGYKQTELGEIPGDWEVVDIDSITSKVGSGKTPKGGSSVYISQGRPLVRSQNIGWGKLLLEDVAYISDEVHETFIGSELREGDVLLNITGASIGRCATANKILSGGNVNQHVCIIRVVQQKADSGLIASLILSTEGQSQIDSFQAGGNREGLNFTQVKALRFALPGCREEQTCIANVLSDMDRELDLIEQRLTKTQQLKQGMMQELLTGKTRLV